jgi:uncharacterized protein (TIGR02270 family)
MALSVEPFVELIEESFGEAAFLWSRWEADLSSLTRNLDEVWNWTEDRLSGALDGALLASASVLERQVEAALKEHRAPELSVLGSVLANSKMPEAKSLLESTLREAKNKDLRALMRGVEVAPLDGGFAPIAAMLGRESPEHAAALARLKAFRRAALGDELTRAYESTDVAAQAAAQWAARYLPAKYAAAWVDAGLSHVAPAVRVMAMESGIRQQIPNAWSATLAFVKQPRAKTAGLLKYVGMLGNETDHQSIYAALREPAQQREAIGALANIGSREAAEHCLLAMKHPKFAKIAGEAYCAITGADLARDKLTSAEADEPTPDFDSDDLQADLVPTPQEMWPLPDLARTQRHWAQQASRFQPGLRYVRGRAASVEALMNAIESGPMLRRPEYAFELFVRTQGKYDLEARATRKVQRQMMSLGRTRAAEQALN